MKVVAGMQFRCEGTANFGSTSFGFRTPRLRISASPGFRLEVLRAEDDFEPRSLWPVMMRAAGLSGHGF